MMLAMEYYLRYAAFSPVSVLFAYMNLLLLCSSNGVTTSLTSLAWTIISYGVRLVPLWFSTVLFVASLWRYLGGNAVNMTTPVHLMPSPAVPGSYIDRLITWCRSWIQHRTTVQHVYEWLRYWSIVMVIPEVIALVVPTFWSDRIPHAFYLPIMALFHIVRVVPWSFSLRAMFHSIFVR